MPIRSRPLVAKLSMPAAAGLAAGGLAQTADGNQWLSEVGSRGGIWLVAIFVVGVLARSPAIAAIAAVTFSMLSLVGYYVMGTLDSGWAPPWATVAFWVVASITVVPALGWLSRWAWHSGSGWAPPALGLIAGGLLAEGVDIAIAQSAFRWGAMAFDLAGGAVIAVIGARHLQRPVAVAVGVIGGFVVGSVAIAIVERLYRTVI